MADLNLENNRLLDVVNENDQVIDLKSRKDIHHLGLLHREIHVWMFDKDKNIFFQKRGLPVSQPSLLDATAGGHVNKSEEYVEAAVRETKEETGISVNPSDLIFLKKFIETEHISTGDLLGTINKFIRSVYLYKHPIEERRLKKESGILGVGFQKFSIDLLKKMSKKETEMFNPFIHSDELPDVFKYLKNDL